MKTFELNGITLNEEQMKEISIAYNKPSFTYPIFKKSALGTVFKYTGLKEFEIVMTGSNSGWKIGETNKSKKITNAHTEPYFKDVPYDRERDLYHGQPVLYWDNSETHSKTMRFYNAKLKCAFSASGMNNEQFQYGNYQAVELSDCNAWHIESYATLELGE